MIRTKTDWNKQGLEQGRHRRGGMPGIPPPARGTREVYPLRFLNDHIHAGLANRTEKI